MRHLKGAIFFSSALLIISSGFVLYLLLTTPSAENLKSCFKTSLYEVELCPKSKSYVELNRVPKHFRNALLVSEDISFYDHNGFDLYELQQSFLTNISNLSYVRGASTITQQLAKNVYLNSDKNLIRKIKEALVTVEIEKRYSKDLILEKYINVVEFGDGIFGLKSASAKYFQKSVDELSLLDSVYLVHMLPNPQMYSKSFQTKKLSSRSLRRIRDILSKMKAFEFISQSDYLRAIGKIDAFPNWNIELEPDLTTPFEPMVEDSSGDVEEEQSHENQEPEVQEDL